MENKTYKSIDVGDTICFDLDTWDVFGIHSVKEVEAIVRSFVVDPLGRREKKAVVIYKGEYYGIPLSEIKK